MRTINSIKNAIVSVIMNIIIILIGFVFQKIFVISLGKEYLGINGLFNNLVSVLSIVELGLGSAIVYNLYRPLSERNYKLTCSLLNFYKKAYRVIALIILIVGMAFMPFLKLIVGNTTINENLSFIFILFLLDTVASYLLTYKRSILYADQKTYIANLFHIFYVIALNLISIAFLLIFNNFVLYLIFKIFMRILENILITHYVNKNYNYILKYSKEPLPNNIKKDILTKVKGLLFHKIGGAVVSGTDNILISKIFGIISVGIYSNYNMIFNAVSTLLSQIFNSITASVGNLLVENNYKKSYTTFKNILFMNSWLYCISANTILCLIQPFIKIWMGPEYLLKISVVLILILNFYIQGLRKTINTFKEAAGIFYEDRFVPIIESIINIVSSIILAKIFGMAGIFMGTICSTAIIFLYSYPIFCYKKIFQRNYSQCLLDHMKYLFISIIVFIISFLFTYFIRFKSLILSCFVYLVIDLLISITLLYLFFRKTNEFNYYLDFIKIICNKVRNLKRRYNEE